MGKISGRVINPAGQVDDMAEVNAINRVAQKGMWAEGEECESFRQELGEYLGVSHVALTNSGSSANLAAILALTTEWIPKERRLEAGDEVITTALCFPTTVSPIVMAGCVPVFVDVERGTWNISPQQVREMISPKTKAIIVAHNLGNPFNIDAILEIAREFNLWVIEDNCDCLGGEWRGKKTGTWGDIGTSSFYPAHHISTGEGGAVYTNNGVLFRAINSIINWGRDCWCKPNCDDTCHKRYKQQLGDLPFGYDHKNTYAEFGLNLKMTEFQGAIGRVQLRRLLGFMEARTANHAFLENLFIGYNDWFEQTEVYENATPNWFGYVIKVKQTAPFSASEMAKYLDSHGIKSRAFFCGNITRQPLLYNRNRVFRKHSDLSVSDDIMTNCFWIGCHPSLGQDDLEFMFITIHKFLEKYECTPLD